MRVADHFHLEARLREVSAAAPFHTGWAFADLREGIRLAEAGDRPVPAASTRKIAILMAALRAVQRGELSLDQRVNINETYRDQVHSGLLQHLRPGLELSLGEVLTLMIIVSDNLSTAHVVRLVGLDAVRDLCGALGMAGTGHRHALIPDLDGDHEVTATNYTTPADQVRLLEAIVTADSALGCSVDTCAFALGLLRRQQYRDALPALLPHDVDVANKTGVGWRDVSDVGVFYADGEPRYVLAVYTDEVPRTMPDGLPGVAAARAHIARMGRACWEEMS
ncbi:serine hydrolase [Streptomyces sp. NPDC055078]